MAVYNKKFVDSLISQFLYNQQEVNIERLTNDGINKLKK